MNCISRSRVLRRSFAAGVLIVLPLLTVCNGESPTSPTSVECINTTYIRIDEPAYISRMENPVNDRGHLRKNCPAGGTYCYFLDAMPINAGTKGSLLEPFVDKEVLIVAKHVSTSGGVEIWPAAICQLRCDGGSRPCLD